MNLKQSIVKFFPNSTFFLFDPTDKDEKFSTNHDLTEIKYLEEYDYPICQGWKQAQKFIEKVVLKAKQTQLVMKQKVAKIHDIARAEFSMKMLENAEDQKFVYSKIKMGIEKYAIKSAQQIESAI